METKVNYTVVGIFVFAVFAASIIFLLWHTNYAQNKHYSYYKINIKESVAGLNQKAPVKLRGVNVGEVDKIFINPYNTEEVTIIIKIDSSTPIKQDSYASLKPQGITGLSYLEIEGGSNESEILRTGDTYDKMATIWVKQSLLSMVDRSFESLVNKLAIILNDKNIENFEKLLEHSAKSSENISQISQDILNEKENLRDLIKSSKQSLQAIESMSNTIASIGTNETVQMIETITSVTQNVNNFIKKLDEKVVEQNLTNFDDTIRDLNLLILEANSLVQRLQESPSDLLFQSTPKKLGPGETR